MTSAISYSDSTVTYNITTTRSERRYATVIYASDVGGNWKSRLPMLRMCACYWTWCFVSYLWNACWICSTVQSVPINESYCGEAEQNGPLVGSIAVESSPILTFSDTQLTSVAAAAVNGHAIIYLGTHHGHLKKVAWLPSSRQHPSSNDCPQDKRKDVLCCVVYHNYAQF